MTRPTADELRKAWGHDCVEHTLRGLPMASKVCSRCAVVAALDLLAEAERMECVDPDAHGPCDVNDLRAKLAEAQRDRERLDWTWLNLHELRASYGGNMETGERYVVVWRNNEPGAKSPTLRAAIDAARASEKEKPK